MSGICVVGELRGWARTKSTGWIEEQGSRTEACGCDSGPLRYGLARASFLGIARATAPAGRFRGRRSGHIGEIRGKGIADENLALVVDNVTMENYWERNRPIYPTGQIELQNHGNTLYFKNVYLREIAAK